MKKLTLESLLPGVFVRVLLLFDYFVLQMFNIWMAPGNPELNWKAKTPPALEEGARAHTTTATTTTTTIDHLRACTAD